MKKTVYALVLAAALLCTAGCMSGGEGSDDTTAADITVSQETTFADTTEAEKQKLFEIIENGGEYSYKLYNLDGTVAEEMTVGSEAPVITSSGDELLRVDNGNSTYYYHLKNRVFSDTFTDVFGEFGTLVIFADGDKIAVCDIFSEDGLYKEFSDFTGKLSGDDPFVSAGFIEDGGAVKVEYNTESGEVFCDCFNISNGSKFVVLSDWLSDLVVITGSEKEQVANYLYGYMGAYDPNTGFPFEYQVKGILKMNGKDYYYCKSFCNVELEDGTVSQAPAGQFLFALDKSERYDCREADGELKVFTENDLN